MILKYKHQFYGPSAQTSATDRESSFIGRRTNVSIVGQGQTLCGANYFSVKSAKMK